jgi:hypothetical protein
VYERGSALASIAQGIAATHPARAAELATEAEKVAQMSTSESQRAAVLTKLAQALAATDPDRAELFAALAEKTARAITSESQKAAVLAASRKRSQPSL